MFWVLQTKHVRIMGSYVKQLYIMKFWISNTNLNFSLKLQPDWKRLQTISLYLELTTHDHADIGFISFVLLIYGTLIFMETAPGLRYFLIKFEFVLRKYKRGVKASTLKQKKCVLQNNKIFAISLLNISWQLSTLPY